MLSFVRFSKGAAGVPNTYFSKIFILIHLSIFPFVNIFTAESFALIKYLTIMKATAPVYSKVSNILLSYGRDSHFISRNHNSVFKTMK